MANLSEDRTQLLKVNPDDISPTGFYEIPDSVYVIGNNAFKGCSGLTSVTIPQSVTSIGPSAFSDCTGLTNITIPQSVTSIGHCAFAGCIGLTSIIIPQSVTIIDTLTFSGCEGLINIIIPQAITGIGMGAFGGCTGLTSITIPQSVTRIEPGAFLRCVGLTTITIPESVTYIGDGAIPKSSFIFLDTDDPQGRMRLTALLPPLIQERISPFSARLMREIKQAVLSFVAQEPRIYSGLEGLAQRRNTDGTRPESLSFFIRARVASFLPPEESPYNKKAKILLDTLQWPVQGEDTSDFPSKVVERFKPFLEELTAIHGKHVLKDITNSFNLDKTVSDVLKNYTPAPVEIEVDEVDDSYWDDSPRP